MKKYIRKYIEKILDTIYPPKCGFCGKIDDRSICENCLKTVKNEAKCIKQSKTKENKEWNFDEHIYLFEYKGIIREKILEYKFKDGAYLYKTFINILINDEKICAILKSYDIITPVPMYYEKKLQRGYNQTELIAKNLYDYVEFLDILKKVKNTAKQSELTRKERLKNLKNAYNVNEKYKEYIKSKKILVFDDIFTTGSTANECATEIRRFEPTKIGILTMAKDFIEK